MKKHAVYTRGVALAKRIKSSLTPAVDEFIKNPTYDNAYLVGALSSHYADRQASLLHRYYQKSNAIQRLLGGKLSSKIKEIKKNQSTLENLHEDVFHATRIAGPGKELPAEEIGKLYRKLNKLKLGE